MIKALGGFFSICSSLGGQSYLITKCKTRIPVEVCASWPEHHVNEKKKRIGDSYSQSRLVWN